MALEQRTVSELLREIENGKIALPDMQRDYVWNNPQVRDLLDSLYRRHPIGMILLWETNPSDNVPVNKIDDTTQEIKDYSELVIDGQQRLTALLLVKNGVIFKGGDEKEIKLLFNPLSETFEIENPRIRYEKGWFGVTEIIKEGEYQFHDQLQSLGLTNDKVVEAMRRMNVVRNIFVGEGSNLPVFTIPTGMNYEEVADIFVKINSKGTRIRITELLLALLALKLKGEFRRDLRDYADQLEANGWDLDPPVLVRTLVAIAAERGRLKQFRSFAEKMSEKELAFNWDKVKKSIDDVLKILDENLGIRSTEILPSQVVLVPIAYYSAHKKEKFTESNTKDLLLWFLLSSFWGRYTGPTETRLEEDIKEIAKTGSLEGLFANLKNRLVGI